MSPQSIGFGARPGIDRALSRTIVVRVGRRRFPDWRHLFVAAVAMTAAACASASTARPSPFPGAAPPPTTATGIASPHRPASPAARSVLDTALALRGTPYRFGGDDPAGGFDCSGFVQYVLAHHQIEVPRTVAEQFRVGVRVNLRDVRAGDLVFFSTEGHGPSHVGFALGDGTFVDAPSSTGVVRIDHLDMPYWHDRFVGARRVF